MGHANKSTVTNAPVMHKIEDGESWEVHEKNTDCTTELDKIRESFTKITKKNV